MALSILAGCGTVRSWYQKESSGPHSVTIQWKASTSPVAGYNVYREARPKGPVKLNAKPVPDTQYVDQYVETGVTYTYYITSVNSKGLESRPSELVSVTVPTTSTPPAQQ